MIKARAVRRGGAVIAALLLTTACLPGTDAGDEETSEPTTKGGQELTEDEIRSALPREDQLPEELAIDEEIQDDDEGHDPESSSYPTTCRDVELDGEEGKALDEHVTAKVTRGYAGSFGGVVNVSLVSHDTPVPGDLLDAAGEAQNTCAEFSKTNKDGTTKWKITPSSITPMGDRTYVVGLEMLSGDEVFTGGTVQLAAVTIGHNLVYIVYSAGPQSQLSTDVVEELARTTVDNLEEL